MRSAVRSDRTSPGSLAGRPVFFFVFVALTMGSSSP
jgi:hypothetical protein